MKPVFAITMGDPCGVGPEIVLKSLTGHQNISRDMTLFVCGSAEILDFTAKKLHLEIPIVTISSDLKELHPQGINCLNIHPVTFRHQFGEIIGEAGKHSFAYIKTAIDLARQKKINGVITAPINKESLQAGSIPYLDHTAMFSQLTDSQRTMTLFVTGSLRVFFLTRHIRFSEISNALDKDHIVQTLADCIRYLKQIGISNPKIALAALNPHGGESGLFGTEEIEILEPAVKEAIQAGLSVQGPIPADSVFHLAHQGHYDAVLSLYHDQGHIATKTLDFHRTVSLTMGLPFIRTSVDHGTAFDIAGKGIASEISLVEAIKAAGQYYWS